MLLPSKIREELAGMSKEHLVNILVMLIVIIFLLYPTLKGVIGINAKLDNLDRRVGNLEEAVKKVPSNEGIRRAIIGVSKASEDRISAKIDGVYNVGMKVLTESNADLMRELSEVKAGNKSMLEALEDIRRRNEQRIKDYRYIDSLRREFQQREFEIGVKPVKMSRR